jgi:hypothetical protein
MVRSVGSQAWPNVLASFEQCIIVLQYIIRSESSDCTFGLYASKYVGKHMVLVLEQLIFVEQQQRKKRVQKMVWFLTISINNN